jgi:hypothetical protein
MQRHGASVMRLGGMKGIAPAVGYRFDPTNDGRCRLDQFSCSLQHAVSSHRCWIFLFLLLKRFRHVECGGSLGLEPLLSTFGTTTSMSRLRCGDGGRASAEG